MLHVKQREFSTFDNIAVVPYWAHKSRLISLLGGFFINLANGSDNVSLIIHH